MGAIGAAGRPTMMSTGGTAGSTLGAAGKTRMLSTGVTTDRTMVSTILPGMRMILTLVTLTGMIAREAIGGPHRNVPGGPTTPGGTPVAPGGTGTTARKARAPEAGGTRLLGPAMSAVGNSLNNTFLSHMPRPPAAD